MQRLKGFDGMRALACLAVLFHHLIQRFTTNPATDWLEPGEVGVSLFFVLSGALLSYPFWHHYVTGQKAPDLKKYAVNRAARIMPAFYLVLLISAILSVYLIGEYRWERFWAAIFFVAPYHYVSFFPSDLDPPLWSIGLEVSCYVLLPFFLLPLFWLKVRRVSIAIGIMVVAIVALQFLHYVVIDVFMTSPEGKGWQYGPIGGAKFWLPYWSITSFMGQFLLGSLAALGIAGLESRMRNQGHFGFDLLAIVGLVTSCWFVITYLQSGMPNQITGQPYLAPGFAAFCALILFSLHYSVVMYKLIDNPLFKHIATLSFGLYLWHFMVMEVIKLVWEPSFVYHRMTDWVWWLELCVITVVVSWCLAAFSYYLFEAPILNWARTSYANYAKKKAPLGEAASEKSMTSV